MDRETAIEKVLMHLVETRGKWWLNPQPCKGLYLLRCGSMSSYTEYGCPINSLAGIFGSVNWHEGADVLGIPLEIAAEIASAADGGSSCDSELRLQMLRAAGVDR